MLSDVFLKYNLELSQTKLQILKEKLKKITLKA
jgi:hypothetical protein